MGIGVLQDKRWDDGIVPYWFKMPQQGTKNYATAEVLRALIRQCMKDWMTHVNVDAVHITFVERSDADDAKNIDLDEVKVVDLNPGVTGAGSNGKATGKLGSQVYTTGYNDTDLAAIPHELGHILGLSHENERNGLIGDHKYSDGEVPRLCLQCDKKALAYDGHLSVIKNNVQQFDYDPGSIMHYPGFRHFVWNKPGAAAANDPNNVAWATKILSGMGIKLRYPTAADVVRENNKVVRIDWEPSPGDIKMVRWMYPKKAAVKAT